MTEHIKRQWRRMTTFSRWFISISFVFIAVAIVFAADTDNDGMSDAYEILFGLNTAADDSQQDPDGDDLVNYNEYLQWSDPFAVDTDFDGWDDAGDSNPVSRAFLDFGTPQFITGDNFEYTAPAWWISTFKTDGNWQTNNPTAWHVSSSTSNDIGSLSIYIDRELLTNNPVMDITLLDSANGVLYLDLCDSNQTAIATNVCGNLITGTGNTNTLTLSIPFQSYSNAVGFKFRRQTGEIYIYDGLLYVDQDSDQLDKEQESQINTSDMNVDSDGDDLGDYPEVFIHNTDPANSDTDADGMNDGNEVYHGTSALIANSYAQTPFIENFETNTVTTGSLHNQNNWTVTPSVAATVQTNTVYAGAQAVEIDAGTADSATVKHLFAAPAGTIVWADWRTTASFAVTPTDVVDTAAAMHINADGQLVVYDGTAATWLTLTNHPAIQETTWTRLTVQLDYSAQKWLLCLNDFIVVENLGFGAETAQFSSFTTKGGKGYLDNINISTSKPSGVSSDWDTMPDDWEQQYFGDLDEIDTGDADSDGLSNLAEYQNGTDPIDVDSDDDGLSDGDEISNSTNPLLKDSDNDGLLDGEEVNLFLLDPLDSDSDNDGINDLYAVVGQSKLGTNVYHKEGTWSESTWGTTNRYNEITSWIESGSTLYATNVARVEYELTAPVADMYKFGICHTNFGGAAPEGYQYRLLFLVDHVRVDTLYVDAAPSGSTSWHYATTPWLTPTSHNFRVVWVNWLEGSNTTFGIKQVGLFAIDGADANTNARQDWVENVLSQSNDIDEDGLSDLAEIDTYNTDPLNSDTDGDHLLDGEEITIFGTDSALADSNTNGINDAVTIIAQDGTSTVERIDGSWPWWDLETSVVNKWKYSSVTYSVNIPTGRMYRVGLQLRNWNSEIPDDWKFRVEVSIDTHYVDTIDIFADNDVTGTGYINTPWLTAGDHNITFRWINSAWLLDPKRRDPNIRIDKVLVYQVDAPDTNNNARQDWMDTIFALGQDSDGDGLTDLQEIDIYHSDPMDTDSDDDGVSDYIECITYGSDPNDPDSDDDGVDDGVEINESLTNPTYADFDGTVLDVDLVYGYETNAASGEWLVSGTKIISRDRRGYVQYTMNTPYGNVHRIKVTATHSLQESICAPVDLVEESDLMVYIDDNYIGKKELQAPEGVYGDIMIFTPWLEPGDHTVKLFWENVHDRTSLIIKELRLQLLGGEDLNSDDVEDWVATSVGNMTDIGNSIISSNSYVSPVCIEGAARYINLIDITANGATGTVYNGILGRWYADMDLSSTNSTEIVASFQNGATNRTTNVTWTALNLLGGDDLTIRADDAVMFSAAPDGSTNGTISVSINGVTNYSSSVGGNVITHTFPTSGTFTVTGTYSNSVSTTNDSITVEVIGASFPTNVPACMLGIRRTWVCTNISNTLTLEADPSVALSRKNATTLYVTMNKVNYDHYIVARIDSNGPIVASAILNGFWVQAAVDNYFRKVTEYPDGSELWENQMVIKNLPDDVDIKIEIVTAGVTLDDLTLERWIDSADFNAIGEYSFQMIRPESVLGSTCHTIKMYQNGLYLGEAYYSGVLFPNE